MSTATCTTTVEETERLIITTHSWSDGFRITRYRERDPMPEAATADRQPQVAVMGSREIERAELAAATRADEGDLTTEWDRVWGIPQPEQQKPLA
jgi:hypothetical protein